MFKKLLRLAGLVSLLVTIVWLTRDYLLPTPRVTDDPKPQYRSTPPPPPTDPDDLTLIKGIGPVFAQRLQESGIQTFRGLSETDATTVAAAVGTTPEAVTDWISQAEAKLT